jgi:hypothetical protein
MSDQIAGADRLAELEEELARVREAQEAADAREVNRIQAQSGIRQPREPTGFAKELQERQERDRKAAVAAHEEHDRRYQEQLQHNAPTIERLRAKIQEIDAEIHQAQERVRVRVDELSAKRRGLHDEIGRLQTPPPMSPIDLDRTESDLDIVRVIDHPEFGRLGINRETARLMDEANARRKRRRPLMRTRKAK